MPFIDPKNKGDWAFTNTADSKIAAKRIIRFISIKVSFLFNKYQAGRINHPQMQGPCTFTD
ncbi:hypothetical protein D3H65_09510 [Paraflavitalea soli]|uniref:Uncharacterized protein n=1 Tax=Paraflavitalea soli TaxID=2315862 RepID=A0A3B7MMN3_9BACT|nr:hypothetical protein D3H65_09510 [Paraflavitalea soli]